VSSSSSPRDAAVETGIVDGLQRLMALPEWLLAPLQSDQVAESLQRHVPEFASGTLALRGVTIKRMLLKNYDGRWVGTYSLTVEQPGGGTQKVALRGTFTPPHLRPLTNAAKKVTSPPFGAAQWYAVLPDLGLELEAEPPETELPAMPHLTDPESARVLLEAGIRGCSPAYSELQIATCRPEILSYKPGSRCTILYHLTYPPELGAHGWPTSVIAKTYRKESKGRNAYNGMVALWATPLARSMVATIAEPLAYLPELKVMVQGPIAGDQSLEDRLKSALKAGTSGAITEVCTLMRKVAVGLAMFHMSGVRSGETAGLDERFAEIRELIARLLVPAPDLARAAEPLLAHLETLAATQPADALVPTHGTFSPEQVLINEDRIGFIDFDDFSMAEPALDIGLFRAAIKDTGMNALDDVADPARQARLALLDQIGEVFLAEYEQHAPISRQRVALWEAWSYFRDVLHFWSKVKPAEPDNAMMMLTHHMRGLRAPANAGSDRPAVGARPGVV
jgi:hypothetical protein